MSDQAIPDFYGAMQGGMDPAAMAQGGVDPAATRGGASPALEILQGMAPEDLEAFFSDPAIMDALIRFVQQRQGAQPWQ